MGVTDSSLARWAPTSGSPRRDVYVHFDNDQHANAPRDALGLATRLA